MGARQPEHTSPNPHFRLNPRPLTCMALLPIFAFVSLAQTPQPPRNLVPITRRVTAEEDQVIRQMNKFADLWDKYARQFAAGHKRDVKLERKLAKAWRDIELGPAKIAQ